MQAAACMSALFPQPTVLLCNAGCLLLCCPVLDQLLLGRLQRQIWPAGRFCVHSYPMHDGGSSCPACVSTNKGRLIAVSVCTPADTCLRGAAKSGACLLAGQYSILGVPSRLPSLLGHVLACCLLACLLACLVWLMKIQAVCTPAGSQYLVFWCSRCLSPATSAASYR